MPFVLSLSRRLTPVLKTLNCLLASALGLSPPGPGPTAVQLFHRPPIGALWGAYFTKNKKLPTPTQRLHNAPSLTTS